MSYSLNSLSVQGLNSLKGLCRGMRFIFQVWACFVFEFGASGCSELFEPKVSRVGCTWAPKVCKIIAFCAIFRGFGLSFYSLLGFS